MQNLFLTQNLRHIKPGSLLKVILRLLEFMTIEETLLSDDEIIDELTGHHLNEVAMMNTPEELGDIDFFVYADLYYRSAAKQISCYE